MRTTKDFENDIAAVLTKAMYDGDLSQEALAKQLRISRKTVQNWLDGTTTPNFAWILAWFDACCVNVDTYVDMIQHPAAYEEKVVDINGDRQMLHHVIDTILSDQELRILKFLFMGRHGGDSYAMLNELCAVSNLPLTDRVKLCGQVIDAYELAVAHDMVSCPEDVQPDMDTLNAAYESGKASAFDKLSYYKKVTKQEDIPQV